MKGKYILLSELTDKTKDFKVRVKVIQKARPSNSGTVKYQHIKFADDKGNEMRGTLFQDDMKKFELALQQGAEYEISNVPIRRVPEQYQIKPNEFQMNFNDRARVIPVDTETVDLLPKYNSIMTVPPVIGVVLFAEETKTVKRGEREQQVREVMLTDYSSERPLVLSLWDDLARSGSEPLNQWAQTFMIVGFTDMQISNHKCFSLRSSMSTDVFIDPNDVKANALKRWIEDKETTLVDRRSKAMEIKFPSAERVLTTMAEIVAKKADKTWQEEKFWVEATIPEATIKNVRSYLGCSVCGRRGEAEKEATYKCLFCNSTEATCLPRVNYAFEATDGTESMKFTIFNDHVEKLFGLKCEDIIKLKTAEQSEEIQEEIAQLRSKTIYLEVGPTAALSASQMLKWTIRSITFE